MYVISRHQFVSGGLKGNPDTTQFLLRIWRHFELNCSTPVVVAFFVVLLYLIAGLANVAEIAVLAVNVIEIRCLR